MPIKGWESVSLPTSVLEGVRKLLSGSSWLGYRSVAEFVQTAVVGKLGWEQELADFVRARGGPEWIPRRCPYCRWPLEPLRIVDGLPSSWWCRVGCGSSMEPSPINAATAGEVQRAAEYWKMIDDDRKAHYERDGKPYRPPKGKQVKL